jgi:Pyruvate/2-oxoacid:ferredoxin oxidoreductase gamma subunit
MVMAAVSLGEGHSVTGVRIKPRIARRHPVEESADTLLVCEQRRSRRRLPDVRTAGQQDGMAEQRLFVPSAPT